MKNNYTYLKIENFRGISELEINFKDGLNQIYGDNGVGKSTILDSITWVLFGKNLSDKKSGFTISPIIDGVERNDLNTKVKLIINNNFIVEREWKDKKTKLQCGFIENGEENLVSMTQTEYKKILSEKFIDEEEFKALSNINYIPSLKWQELKEFIFSLIGEIKDEEVLLNGNFESIEMMIRNFGIEKTTEQIKTTEKQLNESIKTLEIEVQNTINLKEKYVSESEENETLKTRKQELENKIASIKEKQEKNNLLIKEHQQKKELQMQKELELKSKIQNLEQKKEQISNYEELYKANSYNVDLVRQRDLNEKQLEIEETERRIKSQQENLAEKNHHLEEIIETANNYAQTEVKIENETCGACGQKLPEDKIQESLNNLKEIHNSEIERYKNEIKSIKNAIETLEANIKLDENLKENLLKELENIKTKEYDNVEETEKQKQFRVAKEQLEIEVNEISKEIEILKEIVNDYNIGEIKLEEIESVEVYLQELNEINNKLATTITLSKLEEDITSKEVELENKRKSKILNYQKMQDIVSFNNAKAELLKQRVRKYFNLVEFITSETTNDGNLIETFKLAYNGIPYEDLNQSMKILVCLDLLVGIQKIKDKHICILIDNGEQITRLPELNTQLIVTYVKKQEIKKVEVI